MYTSIITAHQKTAENEVSTRQILLKVAPTQILYVTKNIPMKQDEMRLKKNTNLLQNYIFFRKIKR